MTREQRPEQQAVDDDRQHHDEQDDPEDRKVREHVTSGPPRSEGARVATDLLCLSREPSRRHKTSIYTIRVGRRATGRLYCAGTRGSISLGNTGSAPAGHRTWIRASPDALAHPMAAAGTAADRRSASSRSAAFASTAIRSPPDVCGSKSRSRDLGRHAVVDLDPASEMLAVGPAAAGNVAARRARAPRRAAAPPPPRSRECTRWPPPSRRHARSGRTR